MAVPLTAFLAFAGQGSFAQSFLIDWFKIAGGGGTSSGGSFSVAGTIAQADATFQTMTGGSFALAGGFWQLHAVQTAGAPLLAIRFISASAVQVYWPSPSFGFNLQVSADLSTMNWVAPVETVTDDGSIKSINIDPATSARFYRLVSP